MNKTILLIEDNPGIRMSLQDELESQGYKVEQASDGNEGLTLALEEEPDLIVLDIMLPGMDGYEVLKQLRARGRYTPVIMLTVKDAEIDKVLGLELGADDYVTKPFSIRELSARIKTIFRRIDAYGKGPDASQIGATILDFQGYTAEKNGKKIDYTPLELRMLQVFVKNRGIVLSRDQLLDQVWGKDNLVVSLRTIDSHVASIRKKLEDDPSNPVHIMNIRGVGYKLTDPE
jgi:two-component system alkaline phosphatase synthesis response regulator PhoP